DVFKFIQREQRRGRQYDAIIMDTPWYGCGTKRERWKLEENQCPFLLTCRTVTSDNPLFILSNSQTTRLSPTVLQHLLTMSMGSKDGGEMNWGEIGLPIQRSGLTLPCGILGRCGS